MNLSIESWVLVFQWKCYDQSPCSKFPFFINFWILFWNWKNFVDIRIPSNLHNDSFSSFVLMCRVVLSSIFSNIPFKQTSANWTIIHLSFCTPFHHDIVPSWIISSDLKHSTKVTQLKILIYNKSIIHILKFEISDSTKWHKYLHSSKTFSDSTIKFEE